jgi:DNA-binding NarL/FixJ family response regulator
MRRPTDRADDTLIAVSPRPAILALARLVADQTIWHGGVSAVDTPSDLDALSGPSPRSIVVLDREGSAVPIADDMAAVRAAIPESRVVVLSEDASGRAVLEALRLGVQGYVRSPDDLMILGDVVSRVERGETVMPVDLQIAAVKELGDLARRVRAGVDADAVLTRRERQVLSLLADGLTSRQIGNRLAISTRTVERHASGVYRKLDVRTRLQAVARAASMGLVDIR